MLDVLTIKLYLLSKPVTPDFESILFLASAKIQNISKFHTK